MYRIKNYTALMFSISIICFIAIITGVEIPFLIILIGMFFVMAARELPKKTLVVPKIIILLIVFQNTIVGFSTHISGNLSADVNLFSQAPFMLILVSAAIVFLYEFKEKKHILFWIYIIIILLYCFVGNVRNATALLYSIRNLITFYLVFIVGEFCIDTKEKLNDMIKFYIKICIIVGVFGCISYVIGKNIYVFLGVQEVWNIKSLGGKYQKWINGLPGNFYGEFFGHYYIRMASFFLEPINLSPFFALGCILSLCNLKSYKWQFIFLVFCNILTFGKGGLLILCITVIAIFTGNFLMRFHRIEIDFIKQILKTGLIVTAILFASIYWILYYNNYHFQTIRATIQVLLSNPLGMGVGTVGNVSAAAGVSEGMLIGAETGLLNFWCQIGIFGLIVFLIILFRMSKNVVLFRKCDNLTNYRIAFMCLPIILAIEFLFQENTFTVQVISGFMLFQGYFSSEYKHLNKGI